MSNSIDYDRSVNSASEWHSNKLPSIRLESDDASSRLSRNNTPSPKRKFPAKKPLYMRVMEEAKRKEEQENQAKVSTISTSQYLIESELNVLL